MSHAPANLKIEGQTVDERANHCFGCGPENPEGLHLTFTISAEDPANISASATVILDRRHEGPPGHLHGGIIATLMDESMSKLNRPLGALAMTRHMEIDYLRPAPLNTPLTLTARHIHREGRKLFHTAELSLPGPGKAQLLATAKGFFLIIDPALLPR